MDAEPNRVHNNPPEPVLEPLYDVSGLTELLKDSWAHKITRFEALNGSFVRFCGLTEHGFADADTRAKATDFFKQLSDEAKAVDLIRKDVGRPFTEATTTVNTFFLRGIVEPLNAAAQVVRQRMTTHDLAEQRRAQQAADEARRLAREEAMRAEQEAAKARAVAVEQAEDDAALDAAVQADQEAAERQAVLAQAPAASVAPKVQVRGDTGVSTLAGRWKVEIVDPDLIPRQYLTPNLPVIEAAMKSSRVKNGPPTITIAGVRFVQDVQTRVR